MELENIPAHKAQTAEHHFPEQGRQNLVNKDMGYSDSYFNTSFLCHWQNFMGFSGKSIPVIYMISQIF